MTPFKSILVPTDFSETAEQAVDFAMSIATQFGAKITLLHVSPPPSEFGYPGTLALPMEELARKVADALDLQIARMKDSCPGAEAVVQTGNPSERILAVAGDRNVDLIVMGTHGRRGLAHALLGSVAEKIVRRSQVPVLTIGPRGAEAIRTEAKPSAPPDGRGAA